MPFGDEGEMLTQTSSFQWSPHRRQKKRSLSKRFSHISPVCMTSWAGVCRSTYTFQQVSLSLPALKSTPLPNMFVFLEQIPWHVHCTQCNRIPHLLKTCGGRKDISLVQPSSFMCLDTLSTTWMSFRTSPGSPAEIADLSVLESMQSSMDKDKKSALRGQKGEDKLTNLFWRWVTIANGTIGLWHGQLHHFM